MNREVYMLRLRIDLGLITVLALMVFPATVLGQSRMHTPQPPKFLVQGTIVAPPGAEVTFQNETLKRTVITDRTLFYETKFPLGTYTMTVRHPSHPSLPELRRPVFRVASRRTLILNAVLAPSRMTCDPLVQNKLGPTPASEQWDETIKNACGGEEFFLVPSKDGTRFQLHIRYLRRWPSEAGYVYSGDSVATNVELPVLVEYNLFTLTADPVTYDPQRNEIKASGNVVAENASGKEHHADSMMVKFEDGEAFPVQPTEVE
jgi:hypothetical protein